MQNFCGAASAAEATTRGRDNKAERLIAVSTTAISITGDISLAATYIEFAGRRRLPIRYVRAVAGASFITSVRPVAPAQLYRVLAASDVRLLRGNMFCGNKPTFVSVARERTLAHTDVLLTVYSGADAPRGRPTDTICAGYTYTLAEGSR